MMVLIVEDDFALRESLRLIASESGSKVYAAENGQEALSLLSSNSFDLMITDWDMPVLGGYELVQKAVSSYPSMGIVVFSGSFIEVTKRVPGVEYLRKPSDMNKLLEILEVNP